jgi:hypothetical protein
MALQTSGQISLNDLHVEAGGTSGTQASMNDSDIRGLVSAAANSQMTFSSFYGASSSILSTTMTVGSFTDTGGYVSSISNGYHAVTAIGLHGNTGTPVFGAMGSNSVGSIQSGATIAALVHNSLVGIRLVIEDNTALSNSGFTSLKVGSTTYLRTAASFTSGINSNLNSQGQHATWTWGPASIANPFGTSGTKSITIL